MILNQVIFIKHQEKHKEINTEHIDYFNKELENKIFEYELDKNVKLNDAQISFT